MTSNQISCTSLWYEKIIPKIVYLTTDTSTNVIDNGSDNGQSDDTTTGLDPEDNW